MTESVGYTLGIREVLQEVAKVDGKLDGLASQLATLGQTTAVELAEMRMRVTAVEQRENKGSDRRWMFGVSLTSSAVAVVIALFPLLTGR